MTETDIDGGIDTSITPRDALAWAVSARGSIIILLAILALTGTAIIAAMQRTSTTFDEIVMVAGGARGYETGDWHLVPEHPPLVQYVYGLPVYLAGAQYPDESAVTDSLRSWMGYRYQYARGFYFQVGNDPERIAFLGRLPAVAMALGLVLLVFLWTRRLAGNGAALGAAVLTASLPDVLAHGGIAYNDIALALAFLAAVWAIDAALRRPSIRRAAVAGVCIALALGVKNSAIALGPIALILLVWEGSFRWRERVWLTSVARAACVTLVASYVTLVLIYRGDFLLEEYRYAIGFVLGQVTDESGRSFLLGDISTQGFWYFFPVAFLFKTSAALHVLALVAAATFIVALRSEPRRFLTTTLRAPVVAISVFGVFLLMSNFNIGFRHALPALPLAVILTAAGLARAWPLVSGSVRTVIGIALIWPVLHVAGYYPFFISYMSEYGPGEEKAHEILVDSSLDWGQGLLELRRFMREHDIPSVYLSYFGSALPAGYGIRHAPLLSYFPLPRQPALEQRPRWAAVSATNLSGTYFVQDPYRNFREAVPAHIVARTIYLYPMPDSVESR